MIMKNSTWRCLNGNYLEALKFYHKNDIALKIICLEFNVSAVKKGEAKDKEGILVIRTWR